MNHHHHTPIVFFAYGIIVLLGGAYGYVKAKSTPSFVFGIVAALVAFVAGLIFFHHARTALGLAGLDSLALTIVFAIRYSKTKNLMPALPIGALSLLVFLYSVHIFFQVMRQ